MSVSRREVLSALHQHAQSERLCARVADVCRAAARAKQPECLSGQTVSSDTSPSTPLSPQEAETEFGNVLSILDRGAHTPIEWCVLGAALALHIVRHAEPAGDAPPKLTAEPTPETAQLLDEAGWLAAHTGANAWSFLSLHTGDQVDRLWPWIETRLGHWGVAEHLALAVGMTEASSDAALVFKANWLEQSGNPALLSVLEASSTSPWLDGQYRRVPSRALLLLQVASGYFFVRSLAGLVARTLFWRRQHARLRVSPRGLELLSKISILGHTFKERRVLIPLSEVTEVTRQTRFSGLGLYVGLGALLLGTFVGTGLILDALRAPGTSPSLLGLGLAVLLLGLIVDFVLSKWTRVVQGKGELRVRRRSGAGLSLFELQPDASNELIERLARLRAFSASGLNDDHQRS